METWWLFEDGAHDAAWNMAMDEALLHSAAERGKPLLRIYSWAKPAVSIGYFQTFPKGLAAQGIEVVRRPTGGGLVDHRSDVTYTVVLPPSHPIAQQTPQESYSTIHCCILAALKSLGLNVTLSLHKAPTGPRGVDVACFQNPTRFDVMLDGRKVAGAAQRRTKDGLLHQGSIWMGDGGKTREKIMWALPRGFREAQNCQFAGYIMEWSVTTEAQRLVSTRYGTREWNELRQTGKMTDRQVSRV